VKGGGISVPTDEKRKDFLKNKSVNQVGSGSQAFGATIESIVRKTEKRERSEEDGTAKQLVWGVVNPEREAWVAHASGAQSGFEIENKGGGKRGRKKCDEKISGWLGDALEIRLD